jgi:mono/diheme cytochrome c family protein
VAPLLIAICLITDAGDAGEGGTDFFEARIRPVLVEHCYRCHSAEAKKLRGGLRLDSRAGMLSGGDSGPAIAPGRPGESLLLRAIRYEDEDLQMPPAGKLPPEVIADFERWVRNGAPDPRDGRPQALTPPSAEAPEAREFWAFQTPRRHAPPEVRERGWLRGPIDAFVLARMEDAGLEPNPEADRRTLARRLSFDLRGLPPAPEDVGDLVNDDSPDALDRLTDRWLASPHLGERLARLWLDIARYGEDQAHIVGNDRSLCYPNAYLYRDWVLGALNSDLPYDRFLELQLAADLVQSESTADLPALGFLGLGPKYYSRGSLAVMADEWEDRVDVVTRGLLALTVACARCHDHKFDPVSTEDYHALAGVFASTEMFNRPLDDRRELDKNGQTKKPDDALHIVREGKPTDLNVFVRGNVESKGPLVPRRFLRVLSSGQPWELGGASGRRELARAITDPENPLTARVVVNRAWGLVLGEPLVATSSNFGRLGQRPTHPELLDDLAVRFVERGWSLKRLLRELVLSATYRQSSAADRAKLAADPANRLRARMPRRRLDVESWRDALLAAAGRLETAIGGPSLEPQDPESSRRTVYSAVSRLDLNSLLALFDFPDPNVHAEGRALTTTPLQKLFVLNSPFVRRQAEAFARRLAADEDAKDGQLAPRIEGAYLYLLGRQPTADEARVAIAYLRGGQRGEASDGESGAVRWALYCQALLASNEFLFID